MDLGKKFRGGWVSSFNVQCYSISLTSNVISEVDEKPNRGKMPPILIYTREPTDPSSPLGSTPDKH